MYFTVNDKELDALCGLSYLQQITYLRGVRPYMDRKTFIVGIKRRISYQSLAEVLYVEPHQGIKNSGSPSRQQIRRVVKGLERAGLIAIQSFDKHLILKCLLADISYCAQNKANTNPTQELDTNIDANYSDNSINYSNNFSQGDTENNTKADIPHESDLSCVFLRKAFEKFWQQYPQRRDQLKTWEVFKQVNPDEKLFINILQSLNAQIEHHHKHQAAGLWVPHWKNPANWLAQECWNDELITEVMETENAKHTTSCKKQSAVELLWDSCKDGAEHFDFNFEDNSPSESSSNVIQFKDSKIV
ncbi:Legionella vir region protein [Legionella sainthelensi]|uniref:hypothetical protein n=1 Tax=Legionella sainthelensi TaxID=28087 RepID=UPI000F6E9755|nr:hypothetical protein [Legionella sainthelensi]VEB35469.1 Legionella vir region protein [Legionella sainthelensi]